MNALTSEAMLNSVANHQSAEQSEDGEQRYRLIVAVLGYEKMINSQSSAVRVIAGGHQIRVDGAYRASLVGRLHNLLESHQLEVLGIDQSSDPDSFALLMHVSCPASVISSFSVLRRDLEKAAEDLGVVLRVQREELFSYMHRV